MSQKYIKNKKFSSKGFTLVETLVAISILVTVIVGVTAALQTAISSYIFSKNQIIAFYLAQEAFEQIRNTRDENIINGRHWLNGFSENPGGPGINPDPCYFGSYCTVNVLSTTNNYFIACPGEGSCPVVRQNSSTGTYGYTGGWPATEFTREVVLEQISADEISINVVVDWSKGGVTRQFKAKENIFNWLQ